MKKLALTLLTTALLTLGAASAPAQTAPKSVIHVVSVKWKAEATPEQIKAALDGVQALPAAYAGITRVWTNPIKKQGEWSHVFVMEFASEAALKNYADSAAQKK
jgi:Stress responsive A/B Barrel Domain